MLKCWFLFVDYLYVADTRTRSIYEIRKRDGGGSVVVRQGVNNIMNIKAYTPDLHSSMYKCIRKVDLTENDSLKRYI